jgi:hypothetical protein
VHVTSEESFVLHALLNSVLQVGEAYVSLAVRAVEELRAYFDDPSKVRVSKCQLRYTFCKMRVLRLLLLK